MAETSLHEIAAEVAKALAYPKVNNEAALVVTPLLYPGGARVVVRLMDASGGFLVSDYGAGRRESELMGGHRIFTRIARDVASRHGVRFDSDMFFDLEVPREALIAAVIAVSNASKTATDATAEALSERRANDFREQLWDKLDLAFADAQVQRQVEVRGASSVWQFDAAVPLDGNIAVFDVVVPHAMSVHAAVSKFLDLRDAGDSAPHRVAVLAKRSETPHIPLLGRTARMIDLASTADRFRSAA